MSDGGLKLLDGSQIVESLDSLHERVQRRFEDLDPDDCGLVTAAQFQAAAVAEITALLSGIQLPIKRLDHALETLQIPVDDSFRMDRATFTSKLHDLLQFIANALHEEPLVVSVLDGAVIKSLLEDEDDFAMLAENLFTELDVDDSGKLSRHELRSALLQMGVEMGVPVPSDKPEADDLLSSILRKYEIEGDQELGQAPFANLLQGILEELADSLAAHPIVIILNVKVNNGHHLKKALDNFEVFSEVANGIFEEVDLNKNGKLDRVEVRHFLESRGVEWGLPPKEASELVGQLYDELFSISDTDHSGEVDKEEFHVLLKEIFESFSTQLEFNPIFLSAETAES